MARSVLSIPFFLSISFFSAVTATTSVPIEYSNALLGSCPEINGTQYVNPNGTFLIQCDTDYAGHNTAGLNGNIVANFQACLDQCAANPTCVTIAYREKQNRCWTHKAVTAYTSTVNAWSAKLIGPGGFPPTSVSTTSSSSSSSSSSSTSSSSSSSSSAAASFTSSSSGSSPPSATASTSSSPDASLSTPLNTCGIAAQSSDNLIDDPNLQNGGSNTWELFDASFDTSVYNSGGSSIKLSGGGYAYVYDELDTLPGAKTINVQFAAKFTGTGNHYCFLQGATEGDIFYTVPVTSGFDWTCFTTSFVSGTLASQDSLPGFQFICSDDNSALWIDDIYFGTVSPPTTLPSSPSSSSSSTAISTTSSSSSSPSAAISTSSSSSSSSAAAVSTSSSSSSSSSVTASSTAGSASSSSAAQSSSIGSSAAASTPTNSCGAIAQSPSNLISDPGFEGYEDAFTVDSWDIYTGSFDGSTSNSGKYSAKLLGKGEVVYYGNTFPPSTNMYLSFAAKFTGAADGCALQVSTANNPDIYEVDISNIAAGGIDWTCFSTSFLTTDEVDGGFNFYFDCTSGVTAWVDDVYLGIIPSSSSSSSSAAASSTSISSSSSAAASSTSTFSAAASSTTSSSSSAAVSSSTSSSSAAASSSSSTSAAASSFSSADPPAASTSSSAAASSSSSSSSAAPSSSSSSSSTSSADPAAASSSSSSSSSAAASSTSAAASSSSSSAAASSSSISSAAASSSSSSSSAAVSSSSSADPAAASSSISSAAASSSSSSSAAASSSSSSSSSAAASPTSAAAYSSSSSLSAAASSSSSSSSAAASSSSSSAAATSSSSISLAAASSISTAASSSSSSSSAASSSTSSADPPAASSSSSSSSSVATSSSTSSAASSSSTSSAAPSYSSSSSSYAAASSSSLAASSSTSAAASSSSSSSSSVAASSSTSSAVSSSMSAAASSSSSSSSAAISSTSSSASSSASASSTASSTSSSASATSTPPPSDICPADDGSTYQDENGLVYEINCGAYYADNGLQYSNGDSTADTFDECIASCFDAWQHECIAISYDPDTKDCTMVSAAMGLPALTKDSSSAAYSASLVSGPDCSTLSCSGNDLQYCVSKGELFQISCSIAYEINPIDYYNVETLADCIDQCSAITTCVGVDFFADAYRPAGAASLPSANCYPFAAGGNTASTLVSGSSADGGYSALVLSSLDTYSEGFSTFTQEAQSQKTKKRSTLEAHAFINRNAGYSGFSSKFR